MLSDGKFSLYICLVILTVWFSSENVRKIYAIYKVRPVTYVVDKEYFTEEIGRWVKDSSFQNFKIQPFGLVRNRNNFMNKTFTGGIVVS